MFSLGGQWPPASRGKTKPRYSGAQGLAAAGYAYGAITLYGGAFQPTSASPPAAAPGPTTPHLPWVFPTGFGLGSPPFGRPYSGDPCWFLFLPLLRCFRSGGSRSGGKTRSAKACSALAGSPIRGSRVLRLPAPTPGLMQLATPFVGARPEPSTGRLAGVVVGCPVRAYHHTEPRPH